MPSEITPIQVRYSDPKISQYLNVLVKENPSKSKSKILEEISREPIVHAFKTWLLEKRNAGATYSELNEITNIPVPELMELVESDLSVNQAEVDRHLQLIGKRLGIDMHELWKEAPTYELGPM